MLGIIGKACSFCIALVAVLAGSASQIAKLLPESVAWYPRVAHASIGLLLRETGIDATFLYAEFKALGAVLDRATSGDPESVLRVIDETGWSGHFLINIGDVKGKFLDDAVRAARPTLAVELGTFLGYSAVRIGRLLPEGGRLLSVDPSVQANAIASSVLHKAGLMDRVELVYNYSQNVFRRLAQEGRTIDFLLIDHDKNLYLSDIKLALELGLLKNGSVVVGDNVLWPGSPDFLEFVMQQDNGFETVVHDTFIEYSTVKSDLVTVSTYRR